MSGWLRNCVLKTPIEKLVPERNVVAKGLLRALGACCHGNSRRRAEKLRVRVASPRTFEVGKIEDDDVEGSVCSDAREAEL